MTDVAKPTLTYFNLSIRAEVPRLILVLNEVDYEFVGVTDWRTSKAERLATGLYTFSQMPLYQEPGGFSLVQSNAIIRYLAKKYNLSGSSVQEEAKIDVINEGVVDLTYAIYKVVFYTPAGEQREEGKAKFVKDTLPKLLGHFEAVLAKNNDGTGYLVGDKISYADLSFFDATKFLQQFPGASEFLQEKAPLCAGLVRRVGEIPQIKAYLDSNPYGAK
eukprot:TRINITY_DN187_c0_g1_i1.p1 TRINITY_DN187_c0_g1~~TRINITY_DN187_c0_g1_i1.p1  ORF type:complete len:218 (+),score=48.27 TRINITY_DN187_c0_g1_i1:40-693(+)